MNAIVEGLAQVLVRDGWPATTTATIAERAGVSVGTLYQYFDDRDAILDDLLERIVDEQLEVFVRSTAEIAATRPGRTEAIEYVLDGILASVKLRPDLLRRVMLEVPSQRFQSLDQAWKARCTQVVLAALYQGTGDEGTDRNLDVVATLLVGMMFGVVRDVVSLRPELLKTPALRAELLLLIQRYLEDQG